MAVGDQAFAGAQEGRALLTCAVDAINEGRWEDLTWLLQSHSQALHAARKRLEQHTSGTQKLHAPYQHPQVQNGNMVKERQEDKHGRRVRGALPVAQRGLAWLCRWADSYPKLVLSLTQALVLAAYAPGLFYSELLMDDTVGILRNPNVVGEEVSLQSFLERDFWGLPMHGSGWTNKSFRPLTTLTFRWNYLLHGLDSCGFHITNVLLHCLASFVVGHTSLVALGFPGSWAVGCALFFGVHPVHTENVLYLVGRADILSAILGLLALSSYAWCFAPPFPQPSRGAGRGPYYGSEDLRWLPFMALPIALIVASGLCKETGNMFFALLGGLEILNFLNIMARQQAGMKLHPRRFFRMKVRWCILAGMAVLVFVGRYRHTGGTKLNMSPQDNPISFESSGYVRMLSYFFLHGVYVRLLCWPQFLCYDYSMDAIPLVRDWQDCRLLLPLGAYIAVFGALSVALASAPYRRRAGLVSLALMVVLFLPASNIFFPVGTVIGERLLYMPSAGFCIGVAVWLRSGMEARHLAGTTNNPGPSALAVATHKGAGRERSRGPPNGAVRTTKLLSGIRAGAAEEPRWSRRHIVLCQFGCLIALAILGIRTFVRVRVWESAESLFLSDGERQVRSSKVQFNLGITYMQRQEWDSAVEALIRCAWADPLSALPFYRIGQIEIMRGRFQTAESWLSAAIDKFGASLMVRDEEVFHDLAVAMFQNGKVEGAETRLRIALSLNEDFAKGWNNLACCIVDRDMQQAIRAVRRAATIDPENPQYWANLALLSQHTGDWNTAAAAWRQAVSLWPEIPQPHDCTWEFAPA